MRRALACCALLMALVACGDQPADDAAATSSSTTATSAAPRTTPVSRVEGKATLTDSEGSTTDYTFTFDADTSVVFTAVDREAFAYDAAADVFEGSGEGTENPDAVTTGQALGAPDYAGRDAAFFFRRDLGWLVAALARADDPAIGTTRRLNRLAWTYEGRFEANKLAGPGAPDRVTAVIDQATSFPLEVVHHAGDGIFEKLVVTELLIDESTDRERFDIVKEPAETTDDGWKRLAESDAGLRPSFVPEGYELDRVARDDEPGPTGPEASNPVAGAATGLRWTRGLDELVVTVRPAGPDLDHWSNPFGGEGMLLDAQEHELQGGALDGVTAEVVLDPQSLPHLWAIGGGKVVTVAGNATAQELLAVAQSLRT